MILDRVGRLLAQKRAAPSADQWDAERALDLGIIKGKHGEQNEPNKAVLAAIKKMHWISIVCFLERVNPLDLALISGLHERVLGELSKLQSCEPLEVYAAGLESFFCREEIDA
jgi:hypothetical protein